MNNLACVTYMCYLIIESEPNLLIMLNKTGNWIYLIREIPVEAPIDKLSIWYAKPTGKQIEHSRTLSGYSKLVGEIQKYVTTSGISVKDYQDLIYKKLEGSDITPTPLDEDIKFSISAEGYTMDDFVSTTEIITPFGPVTIHPEEYNQVDLEWSLDLVDEGSHIIRYLDNDGSVRSSLKNTSVSEKVYYLRTRGISYTDAMRMVSGEIKTQHLMYFDPLPQYIDAFSRTYAFNDCQEKIDYCNENGYEHLLYYETKTDGDFHLSEFIEHVNEEAA